MATTDLYDLARPVRDVTWAEVKRVAGDEPHIPTLEGHRVGTHLAAVMMAFTAHRHQTLNGLVRDDDLLHVIAIALGQAIAYAAGSFRPMQGGVPVSPSVSGQILLHMIAGHVFTQLVHQEAGAQDFVVPFKINEKGEIVEETFDLQSMLKGGAK